MPAHKKINNTEKKTKETTKNQHPVYKSPRIVPLTDIPQAEGGTTCTSGALDAPQP
jgi:hypothetical protein